jgi:DNA-binding NarL/FixJ family response regulator
MEKIDPVAMISRTLVSGSPTALVVGTTTANFGLTQRESEILPLLLDGSSNEDIGEKLSISPHTVKNHISVMFRKTGAKNRFDLLKTLNRTVAEE